MNMRWLVLMLCLLTVPAWARPQLKIVTLQHRLAEEVLAPLQGLVGPGSSVSAFGNQIIINAEPAEIGNIEETLRQLDVERRRWRISVSSGDQNWARRDNVGVSGNVGNRHIRVWTPNGRREMPDSISIDANEVETQGSSATSMTLTALEGAPAFISVGQMVPYSGYWVDLSHRYARGIPTTDWQEVTTGFSVKPRQVGDQVDLEITPRMVQLGGNGVIDFVSLSTHVQLKPGEWLDLGGLLGSRDEVSQAILQNSSTQGSRAVSLKIKVE